MNNALVLYRYRWNNSFDCVMDNIHTWKRLSSRFDECYYSSFPNRFRNFEHNNNQEKQRRIDQVLM